jgi:hypothetical protein
MLEQKILSVLTGNKYISDEEIMSKVINKPVARMWDGSDQLFYRELSQKLIQLKQQGKINEKNNGWGAYFYKLA